MGNVFTLTASTKSIIQAALDDLITELGKNCRVVYPAKLQACPNCIYDSSANKSSNRYKTGGPQPFANGGICPFCHGYGKQKIEETEIIQFLCAWQPRDFFYPLKDVDARVPGGYVQIKGFLTDLHKIQSMDHLIFQVDIEHIIKQKYALFGEPGDASNIIQNRYFIATLKRK